MSSAGRKPDSQEKRQLFWTCTAEGINYAIMSIEKEADYTYMNNNGTGYD